MHKTLYEKAIEDISEYEADNIKVIKKYVQVLEDRNENQAQIIKELRKKSGGNTTLLAYSTGIQPCGIHIESLF